MPIDVVIPVHNEAAALKRELADLHATFSRDFTSVRFLIVENGSTDATADLLDSMGVEWCLPLTSPVADYGAALRLGVSRSTAPIVLLAEIDFCDIDFAKAAYGILIRGEAKIVQSSKAVAGAVDRRPPIRRLITWGFNRTLRLVFGFSGTDTHGMKMAERQVLMTVLEACVLDGNLLATEMILRAQRINIATAEVPVSIEERRATSIGILRRVPSTLRDLQRLRAALRD